MKIHFDNAELPHIWAHQKQSGGHGSHFWFRDSTIYSYNEPIARLYKGCVLFTSRGYSSTTAVHQGLARAAVNHLTVFEVPNPEDNPSAADVKVYAERIEDALVKASRARTQRPVDHYNSLIAEANKFCEQFKFKTRFKAQPLTQAAEVLEKRKADTLKAEKKVERKRLAEQKSRAADLQKWLAGEAKILPGCFHDIYLRRREGIVETSRGVRFLFEDAAKLFVVIAEARRLKSSLSQIGVTLGGYSIDSIDSAGNVKAGCHFVKWEQIEDFAKREGLTI